MSDIKQANATEIKPGNYVIFDGKACVVKDVQKSKPGKHGHAKCRIEAISIIDDQKIIKVMPGHDRVDVPIIEKKNAQVLSVAGESANVMDTETYETFDIKIPGEMKGQIKEGSSVVYWIVLGQRVIKQSK
ncbi:MAG: translation initiation factor IF-5A [Nanoarchaeota archaeon]